MEHGNWRGLARTQTIATHWQVLKIDQWQTLHAVTSGDCKQLQAIGPVPPSLTSSPNSYKFLAKPCCSGFNTMGGSI